MTTESGGRAVLAQLKTRLAKLSPKSWLAGHPRGLVTLFLVEIWERGSFYGMRAILTGFLCAAVADGGLGFSEQFGKRTLGYYGGLLYLLPLLGGFLADRFWGPFFTLVLGGIIIVAGHATMVFSGPIACFLGLVIIALGTGLLKPNITRMVGMQYAQGDPLRDSGFLIMYCGINVGAAVFPLLCGEIAEGPWFKKLLVSFGCEPTHSWHWAFALAGIGMVFGLLQLWWHYDRLKDFNQKPQRKPQETVARQSLRVRLKWRNLVNPLKMFTQDEKHKLYALGALFVAFVLFCAITEQAGSTLERFGHNLTDRVVFGHEISSASMMALNPFIVILLTPFFAWLWQRFGKSPEDEAGVPVWSKRNLSLRIIIPIVLAVLAVTGWIGWWWALAAVVFNISQWMLTPLVRRQLSKPQPSSPKKFSWGLGVLAFGACLMVPASLLSVKALVSPWWLVAVFFFETVAEMLMSPVGNAAATKLAPKNFASLTVSVWFLSYALGSVIAGYLAGLCSSENPAGIAVMFGGLSAAAALSCAVFFKLTSRIEQLIGPEEGTGGGAH